MSQLGNDILRAHKDLAKRLGKPTFRWKGGDYACIANTAAASSTLAPGGFSLDPVDLTIFVEIAILPVPGPGLKQTLVYKGKTYRIETIAALPGDAELKIVCNDATKGA